MVLNRRVGIGTRGGGGCKSHRLERKKKRRVQGGKNVIVTYFYRWTGENSRGTIQIRRSGKAKKQ